MAISAVYVGRAGCSLVLFKRNIFRSPAFSLRFFDVHVVAPAVSKRISAVLFPCERKGSRGVLLVEIHLPGSLWPSLVVAWVFARREWGPSVWPTLVIEWVFVRRVRRLRLSWAFGRLSYISRDPSLWPSLVIEWVFARRERRLRLFWACVRLSYISRDPSFWPRLVIEWVFVRRVRRLRQFWACLRLS